MQFNVIAAYRERVRDKPDVEYSKTFGPFEDRRQADMCLTNQSALATCQGGTVEPIQESVPLAARTVRDIAEQKGLIWRHEHNV